MKKILTLLTLIIFLSIAQEVNAMQIKISVGGKTFDAVLEDNAAAQEFYKMLPLEITMNELNQARKKFAVE